MIVAVAKIGKSGSNLKKYIENIAAIILLDTNSKKLVTVASTAIIESLKNGSISITNLGVIEDDLVEKTPIAFSSPTLGRHRSKNKRILYKYFNLIVIGIRDKISVLEVDNIKAKELETQQLEYDRNVYGSKLFRCVDIKYEDFEPVKEEAINEVEDVTINEVEKPVVKVTEQVVEISATVEEDILADVEDVGDSSCPICHGKGRYKAGLFGLLMTCECVAKKIEREASAEKAKMGELVYNVTGAQKIQAVAESLIPDIRKDDEFDADITKENIISLYGIRNGTVSSKDFKAFASLLNGIIAGISIGIKQTTSYMIGAPNGFGKTTFANTCIKRLYARGKKAVPYRSLLEIAELRSDYIKGLNKQFKRVEYKKEEDDITYEEKTYAWKEYCNAEIVFCYLTTPENGWVEMNTLKALVSIRATNGLATIVMMDSSLQVYKNNTEIRRYVLDDILAPDKEHGGLDRLVHQSVYVIYRTGLEVAAGRDF